MPRALPREWYGEAVRNAGVERERVRLDRRTVAGWAAAGALLLGSLLLYVTQGIQVIRMGYAIDSLQDRYRALKAERGRLEVELASLHGLQAIERDAVERLGMVFPGPGQVIVVRRAGDGLPVAGDPTAGRQALASR